MSAAAHTKLLFPAIGLLHVFARQTQKKEGETMEFYLIQTFTTAARPHFAEALRLVQDTAYAEEEAHLTVLSSAAAFAYAAGRPAG